MGKRERERGGSGVAVKRWQLESGAHSGWGEMKEPTEKWTEAGDLDQESSQQSENVVFVVFSICEVA